MEDWTSKYAPTTLDEMIVAPNKRSKLESIIEQLPNVLLYGKQGTGKSCFIKILLNKSEAERLKINASFDNGIDIVRNKVSKFARSYSTKDKKMVIFEESDFLTEEAQNALKDEIDKVKAITSFVFICNSTKNIIDPIKSRCNYILDLEDPPIDDIIEYIQYILNKEKINYNIDDIYKLINSKFPDIRSMIKYIQSNSINNKLNIDEHINKNGKTKQFKTAEQRREVDRNRLSQWHKKQKSEGKKQISCMISDESYEILQNMNGSYSQNIDYLIKKYGSNNN